MKNLSIITYIRYFFFFKQSLSLLLLSINADARPHVNALEFTISAAISRNDRQDDFFLYFFVLCMNSYNGNFYKRSPKSRKYKKKTQLRDFKTKKK